MRAIANLEAVKLDLKNTQDLAKKMGLEPMTSTQIPEKEVLAPSVPKPAFPDFIKKVFELVKIKFNISLEGEVGQ